MIDPDLLKQVRAELDADEDERPGIYDDATGRPPILAQWKHGVLVPSVHPKTGKPGKVTVGLGRNLSDRDLSPEAVEFLFAEDLQIVVAAARRIFLGFDLFTRNRQAAILNLLWNMGEPTFLDFKDTIKAMRVGDWVTAAEHLGRSRWARQVQKSRSERIIRQVREG